jgi:hypothetical protein
LENVSYKTYAEPLLLRIDYLGTSALDTVETSATKIKTSLDSTQHLVEERVNTVKTSAYGAFETSYNKLVNPVDNYLKDSPVSKPYTYVLDVAEKYFPAEQKEINGPISRTTTLAVTVPTLTLARLQALSKTERPKSVDYTVDLLKHAAQALDNGVYTLGQQVGKGVASGTTLVKEAPKEVREKVTKATTDALAALSTAIEAINAKLPAPVSTKLKQLTEAAKQEGKAELQLFTSVAQSSSKLIQDVSNSLIAYVQKGEAVPQHLLTSGLASLHKVYESLVSFVETKKHDKESNGAEPSVDNIGGSN